jgi:hypothetical protein
MEESARVNRWMRQGEDRASIRGKVGGKMERGGYGGAV